MPSRPVHAAEPAVTAVRLALWAAALPSLVDVLTIGDRVRMALLHCSDGHPVFAGRDAAEQVMRGPGHEHAWFLLLLRVVRRGGPVVR
jgi:hypothetical protein